jgi:hypothetical protein
MRKLSPGLVLEVATAHVALLALHRAGFPDRQEPFEDLGRPGLRPPPELRVALTGFAAAAAIGTFVLGLMVLGGVTVAPVAGGMG